MAGIKKRTNFSVTIAQTSGKKRESDICTDDEFNEK